MLYSYTVFTLGFVGSVLNTVNSEIFERVLNPREMAKSLCRLLIYVNHALVAIFFMSQICLLALFDEIKSRKVSE